MINLILRLFWIWRFKRTFKIIQKRAKRVLKERDVTHKLNARFHKHQTILKGLGVKEPKSLVYGTRPPTGKIK